MNKKKLIYSLVGKPDPLWINKALRVEEHPIFNIAFSIYWPNRSIWEGKCPTSQEFEFVIKRKGYQHLIWSRGLVFLQAETPVNIPGPTSRIYKAHWKLDSDDFYEEGVYTLEATFLATGHKETRKFEVKFAI